MTEATGSLVVGVPRETLSGERRVAIVPAGVTALTRAGLSVVIESGAGNEAGFLDESYTNIGATIVGSRAELFQQTDIILQVRACGANLERGSEDESRLKPGQIIIAHCEPLAEAASLQQIAGKNVTVFALEMLPRITRAQSMDVLSSMATIAGYKAVLIAANTLPRMFPMMMTAAGTITPSKVLVVGAGVAGLQAIASAKRLGAVVHAYDIRAEVKEQVESLGGKFVELELESQDSSSTGGYAKQMDEEFYRKQRELMARVVAECDVVITTAAIPGKTAPILVTAEMVEGMQPGSVIVDLAAERGGNCELTRADETIVEHGVTIVGPVNLPATIPLHASEMYSRNITTFLLNIIKEGQLDIDLSDEIVHDTLMTRDGDVVNARVREILNLPTIDLPMTDETSDESSGQESIGQEQNETDQPVVEDDAMEDDPVVSEDEGYPLRTGEEGNASDADSDSETGSDKNEAGEKNQ